MIQINNREITPFGGIHLVHKEVMAKGLAPLIHDELGERNDNTRYSYSDLILNMSYTAFCGGDCAEDINYVNSTFQYLKGLKTPSPDCILNMQKELSTPAEEVISDSGIVNKVNVNYRMNQLLVKTAVHLEQLQPKQSKNYCLDFDHQFIPTEKYDATYSYKGQKGYFPGVASIDNIPVYIENRNGNCNVMLQQLDTLQRTFSLLSENDIQPARCRMDSGSYIKEVCDWLHANDITFYIRANQSEQLLFEASLSDDWNKCVIGVNEYEVCSIEHKFGKYTHRVVVYRWPNKTGQVSAITADANLSKNQSSYVIYTLNEGHLGSSYGLGNGSVNISTFDTINRKVTGTFSFDLEKQDGTFKFTNGEFNVTIAKLFCKVDYDIIPSLNDLFNKWDVIGIYNHSSEQIDYPPCLSRPYIKFTNQLSDSINYSYSGNGTINSFGGVYELLSDSTLLIKTMVMTEVGAASYYMDYEDKITGLLYNDTLNYQLFNNILELKGNNDNTLMLYKK